MFSDSDGEVENSGNIGDIELFYLKSRYNLTDLLMTERLLTGISMTLLCCIVGCIRSYQQINIQNLTSLKKKNC